MGTEGEKVEYKYTWKLNILNIDIMHIHLGQQNNERASI